MTLGIAIHLRDVLQVSFKDNCKFPHTECLVSWFNYDMYGDNIVKTDLFILKVCIIVHE